MANLRVDKITSTETFETTGSVQFDGSSDYLSLAVSSDFQFGSGDFTIECWALAFDEGTDDILGIYNTGSNRRTFALRKDQTESMQFLFSSDGSSGTSIDSADGIISLNTWHHYAVVRKDLEYTIYLDGKNVGSKVSSDAIYTNSDDGLRIGSSYNTDFDGHISNVRIIKGTALYTENFKPPMRELEVVPGTVLLACQSKTDATLEKTGKTLTANGTAVASELTPGILTPVPKVGGSSAIKGSVEFTSTNDALVLSAGEDFAYGTGDFTIEAWIQPQGTPNGETKAIFTQTQSGNDYIVFKVDSDKAIKATFGSTTVSGGTVEVGSWHHVAVTRASNTVKIFVNGVASAGTTVSTDFSDTTRNPTIGQYTHTYGNIEYYGFISNLRVVKGTALYTDDFIPPTRELKKVPGTVLLCCQDPDNPLTEATGKTITGYGDLQRADGVELVSNGTFHDGTTGWTAQNAAISVSSGQLTVDDSANAGSYSSANQNVTTDKELTYLLKVEIVSTTGTPSIAVYHDGWSAQAGNVYYSTFSTVGTKYILFKNSSSTTSTISVQTSGTTSTVYDNISVTIAEGSNKGSNFTPQVGDDRKVTFEGVTKINTENYFYLPTGDTASREATGTYNAGTRAIFGAIEVYPTAGNSIHYATIATFGNTVDFGDLVVAKRYGAGCASKTRGLFGGGSDPAPSPNNKQSSISYITIASTGDSLNFGDLTTARWAPSAFSNATRGIWFSGNTSPANTNVIDYVTIASKGNAQDFGDAFSSRRYPIGSTSDTTRGIDAGGHPASDNVIQYVTIASTGNAQDFGDLMQGVDGGCGGVSNGTRGVFAGGYTPTQVNTIQYITIQSMGNSKDFGDMTSTDARHGAAAESSVRGLFTHGGYPSRLNTIDAITIATTGNAVEFGDIIDIGGNDGGGDSGTQSGFSNGHGGLG